MAELAAVRIELAEAQERAQIGEAVFSRSLAADNAEHQVRCMHLQCSKCTPAPQACIFRAARRGAYSHTAKASCLP